MNQNHRTDLIVALDYPRPEKALVFIKQTEGLPILYKIGLELFMGGGPDFVRELVHQKKRVFLDLKFHDIPTAVARAAKQAALLHVELITLHLSGGSAMVRAVLDEFADMPLLRPKILGVTVLTSFDDVRWAEVSKAMTGHAVKAVDSVVGLVESAIPWGVDGVVCSPMELDILTLHFPGLYTVVAGIRLEGSDLQDQARVTTPAQARAMGARAIIVGRAITDAPDPRRAVESILGDLESEIAA